MGAELALAVQRGKEVLRKTSDLGTIAASMISDEIAIPSVDGVVVEFPKLPVEREYTSELDEMVTQVGGVFGRVNLETRRTLSDRERVELRREHRVLDFVAKMLSKRIEDIKVTVRTDMDVQAEEAGLAVPKAVVRSGKTIVAATPRDQKGHYILGKPGCAYRVPINGTGEVYSQEYRQGKVTVHGEKLLDLYESGDITRQEYLALTRETRVMDEGRAGEFIRGNPERGLEILKLITTQESPTTQLYVRKA